MRPTRAGWVGGEFSLRSWPLGEFSTGRPYIQLIPGKSCPRGQLCTPVSGQAAWAGASKKEACSERFGAKALSLLGGGHVRGCWLPRGAFYPAVRSTFCHSRGGAVKAWLWSQGASVQLLSPCGFGCPKNDGLYVTTEC